jgi:hypothetical protein
MAYDLLKALKEEVDKLENEGSSAADPVAVLFHSHYEHQAAYGEIVAGAPDGILRLNNYRLVVSPSPSEDVTYRIPRDAIASTQPPNKPDSWFENLIGTSQVVGMTTKSGLTLRGRLTTAATFVNNNKSGRWPNSFSYDHSTDPKGEDGYWFFTRVTFHSAPVAIADSDQRVVLALEEVVDIALSDINCCGNRW